MHNIDPELSIQKLANYPTNRETRRKLTRSEREAFTKLYYHLSSEVERKIQHLPKALQLFSSVLVDIAENDDLKDLINANELTEIRNDIQQSMEQISMLDKVLQILEKLTGKQDADHIHALFKQIIEASEQALSFSNQFYATMYHRELAKITQTRQEIAFTFDETHSRDDIRRILFGDA
ncbi:hypothetical protein BV912_04350 [Neisseria dumasiana]|uniref:Uncharacterized protein n=2 Tax=Neisseria dumasiana TaxID=1931275 RepID=A0A1X3DJ21_9NEIS|nr:hypothetical protein BV912_04350 [Neisseria dumasiana]